MNEEKKFQASQYKLDKASRDGDVARSRDITRLGMLTYFSIWFSTRAVGGFSTLSSLLGHYLGMASSGRLDNTLDYGLVLCGSLLSRLVELMIGLLLIAVLSNLLQAKFRVAVRAISLDMSKLLPWTRQGGRRSLRERMVLMVFSFVKSVNILFIVCVMLVVVVFEEAGSLFPIVGVVLNDVEFAAILADLNGSRASLGVFLLSEGALRRAHLALAMFDALSGLVCDLMTRVVIVLFPIGIIDYCLVRRLRLERLMMGINEVKQENRESEGEPEQKAYRRQIRQEILLGPDLGRIKGARVVVTSES